MNSIIFDFNTIADLPEFYRQFCRKCDITMAFGDNLDAFWDALTGMIDLPVCVTLHHLSSHADPQQFRGVVAVMREAEAATAGKFCLRIR